MLLSRRAVAQWIRPAVEFAWCCRSLPWASRRNISGRCWLSWVGLTVVVRRVIRRSDIFGVPVDGHRLISALSLCHPFSSSSSEQKTTARLRIGLEAGKPGLFAARAPRQRKGQLGGVGAAHLPPKGCRRLFRSTDSSISPVDIARLSASVVHVEGFRTSNLDGAGSTRPQELYTVTFLLKI